MANGGIDTHPDTGRTKLNIATMAPNLAYVENSTVIEIATLPHDMHKNSIRHLAVGPEGQVAFGMQWQGDGLVAALVGTHERGQQIALMQAPANQVRQMSGYIGSIAYSKDGATVAVTSPRGGVLQLYETDTLRLMNDTSIADVCGIAVNRDNFVATSGNGTIVQVKNIAGAHLVRSSLSWDNHLVSV